MPLFKSHKVSSKTNLLLIGDSGAGKTSSLATLANADYKLWIFDFDAGLDILASLVQKEKQGNIRFKTLRDDILAKPTAFAEFRKVLKEGWTDDDLKEPVKLVDLGPEDVIVVDTTTFMGDAALDYVEQLNPGLKDRRLYYGDATELLSQVLSFLTGPRLNANVICTAHVLYVTDDVGVTKAYPTILGKTMPTKIGRYFNNVFRVEVKPTKERILRTVSDHRMDLKNVAPSLIKPEMPVDLANIIKLIKDNAVRLEDK